MQNFRRSEHIVLWWYTVHSPEADRTCTVGLWSAACFWDNSCHWQCITTSTLICCYLQDYRAFTRLCWEVHIVVCRYGGTQEDYNVPFSLQFWLNVSNSLFSTQTHPHGTLFSYSPSPLLPSPLVSLPSPLPPPTQKTRCLEQLCNYTFTKQFT